MCIRDRVGRSRSCQSRPTRRLENPGAGSAQRNGDSRSGLTVPPEVGTEPLGDHQVGDHQVVPGRLREERLTGIFCPRCVEQTHGLGFPGAGLASIGKNVICQATFAAQGPLGGNAGLSGVRAQPVPRDQALELLGCCLLYTSPSPRDLSTSRMPSSA